MSSLCELVVNKLVELLTNQLLLVSGRDLPK